MLQLSNGGSHASVTDGLLGSEAVTLRFRTGLGAEITCVQLPRSWSGGASCEHFTFIAGKFKTQTLDMIIAARVSRQDNPVQMTFSRAW